MMKVILSIVTLMTFVAAAQAQRPGGPPGGFGRRPNILIMTALDADKDGKISAEEIEGAVAALRKLDKDQDGRLSGEEIGWPPSFGPGGFPGFGGGGRGGRRFGGGGFGPDGGGRPQRPDPDSRGGRASGGQSQGGAKLRTFFSADQLKRLDRNKDGTITREEIPRLMRELVFGRLDTNKDGAVDKAELARLAEEKP